MSVSAAILLKLVSVFLLALMGALVRSVGPDYPVGQVVFFRSACAIVPVLLICAWRGQLPSALRTSRLPGHVLRGAISVCAMFLNFASLARLPLMDATSLTFAAPLMTVILAAIFLNEKIRIYRWSAVAVGFLGVLVMLWPYLTLTEKLMSGSAATVGAICAMLAAFANAGTVIQTRRLTDSETTEAIVFYFSLSCATAGLLTSPFGWLMPSGQDFAILISIGLLGGTSHLLMTESFRYAPASVVAPFDYTSLFWAFVFGYLMFGELPSLYVYVGATIVAAAGLFVIWRERRRGVERIRPNPMDPLPVGD